MFTGIIESLAVVKKITHEGSNMHLQISTPILNELKIDQSLAHNGVCLTVVAIDENTYTVTAIQETLQRSNIGQLKQNDLVNLERAMVMGARLDGHLVQGHVDATAQCIGIFDENGSWKFTFRYKPTPEHILVDKGSVCINGVSLTVVEPIDDIFSVAIIPYTFEHTTFKALNINDFVNIEFDIIGKYISKYAHLYIK